MALYTMTLNDVLNLQGFDIGLKSYPIFDEEYRETLNNKIIEHFRFCEIGAETPQLFKFYLNRTMAEIMPYYNQLYLSEKIKIDPFNAINISETETAVYKGTDKGTSTQNATNSNETQSQTNTESNTSNTTDSTSDSNSNNKNKNLYSQTPSGKLAEVEAGQYLTNATFNTDENTQTSTDTAKSQGTSTGSTNSNATSFNSSNLNGTTNSEKDSTNTITRSRKGNDNSDVLAILQKLRDSFLNIDMMILNSQDLNDCFMLLWG